MHEFHFPQTTEYKSGGKHNSGDNKHTETGRRNCVIYLIADEKSCPAEPCIENDVYQFKARSGNRIHHNSYKTRYPDNAGYYPPENICNGYKRICGICTGDYQKDADVAQALEHFLCA